MRDAIVSFFKAHEVPKNAGDYVGAAMYVVLTLAALVVVDVLLRIILGLKKSDKAHWFALHSIGNFFVAGNSADRGGVRLAAVDLDGDHKADVVAAGPAGTDSAAVAAPLPAGEIRLSARTGAGLDALRHELLQRAGWQAVPEGVAIARKRHVLALQRAAGHLAEAAAHAAVADAALDLFAEDLRLAHMALAEITGAYTADDLLGEIFGNFCIGK